MVVQVGCVGVWLAWETRAGVVHAKFAARWAKDCAGGPGAPHAYAAGGLRLSTICRRRHLDHREELVRIRVDEQDVKKSGVDRQKPTSS